MPGIVQGKAQPRRNIGHISSGCNVTMGDAWGSEADIMRLTGPCRVNCMVSSRRAEKRLAARRMSGRTSDKLIQASVVYKMADDGFSTRP
jgi:hypothetical protein